MQVYKVKVTTVEHIFMFSEIRVANKKERIKEGGKFCSGRKY